MRIHDIKKGSKGCILFSTPVLLMLCMSPQAARSEVYEVGPGKALSELTDVPWESLGKGDQVLVYWRQEPYKTKIIIAVQATENEPFVLRGIPGPGGELPVIDGRDAVTRQGNNFWNESRGVIKIGGSNSPSCDPPECVPSWIMVENLDVRSGRPPYTFTGRNGRDTYAKNAASIYVETARHLTIRNCKLHDSGNGLFIGAFDGETRDVLVEGNHIYDNGIEDSIYEHNSYTSARNIVFQFNHYGPLRQGCRGNNLKDRSAGLVVRYNWIENGNRQLDLVDAEDTDVLVNSPEYRKTFVYGNILVEADGEGNSQIIHYGGDSGDTGIYRKGTLYLYNNTIVSTRSGNTTLLRLSTNDEHCKAYNNIIYASAGGPRLALLASNGVLDLSHNWLNSGWRNSHDAFQGTINDLGGNITGDSPGFLDEAGQNFHLAGDSAAIDSGTALPAELDDYALEYQYVLHQAGEPRPAAGQVDMGAFEYCTGDQCRSESTEGNTEGTAEGEGVAREKETSRDALIDDERATRADAGDVSDAIDPGADRAMPAESDITDDVADQSGPADSAEPLSERYVDTVLEGEAKTRGAVSGDCGCSNGPGSGNASAAAALLLVLFAATTARRRK